VLVIAIAVATLTMLFAGLASAGPQRIVRGVVTQRDSPLPIAGAAVLTEDGAMAVSDIDGYFTIETADRELTVAASGYLTTTVPIPATDTGVLRIELAKDRGSEVIEVVGRAPEQTKPLSYQLTQDEIRYIPGAGNDILRAVQFLPGVARIPYSFGGLVLRGTSPRDTAVFLDGIEVPIAFHFGGVTSFYPAGMLADLTVTNGGFDASHGHAQGGIITLTTREPRSDRWRMGGSIGLLDSSIQVEGPLPGRGGMIAGLRRSYIDAIVRPFVEDNTPLPSYWDFQVRTGWGDSRRCGRITPMLFASIDRVANSGEPTEFDEKISITSMFIRVAAPYLRQWGPLTLTVVPWLGINQLKFESKDTSSTETFKRPRYPGGVRGELARDYAWGHLRGGIDVNAGHLAQTQIDFDGGDGGPAGQNGSSTLTWGDLALWAETRWKLAGERFAVKPGVRVEAYGLTGELVVDPRLNIHQQLTDELTLRQSIGRFHQPPTPGDVDPIGGNPALDSSHVDQMSLGLDTRLPASFLVSLTGFSNWGDDIGVRVRNPRPGSDQPEPNRGGLGPTIELLLEKEFGFGLYRENVGRAKSMGLEVLIKRHVGNLFTMVAYTLSKSQRVDDPRRVISTTDLSVDIWRPFELDQRHNFNGAVSYMIGNWRFGARLQLVSGNPYRPENPFGAEVEDVPWQRLPVFASLDVRVDHRWHRCWGDINFYLDIMNVTNRDNVEGREAELDPAVGGVRYTDIPGLPIIPFIGVEFLPLL
jgi:hypothetical protein